MGVGTGSAHEPPSGWQKAGDRTKGLPQFSYQQSVLLAVGLELRGLFFLPINAWSSPSVIRVVACQRSSPRQL